MDYNIFRPFPSQAAELAELQIKCWHETYSGIVPEGILSGISIGSQQSVWNCILENESKIVFAAYSGTDPVGFIVGGSQTCPAVEGIDGHIDSLYVARAYQRKHVGRALLARLAETWQISGGRSLSVGALVANQHACRFYERLGGKAAVTRLYRWSGYELPQIIYTYEYLDDLKKD